MKYNQQPFQTFYLQTIYHRNTDIQFNKSIYINIQYQMLVHCCVCLKNTKKEKKNMYYNQQPFQTFYLHSIYHRNTDKQFNKSIYILIFNVKC